MRSDEEASARLKHDDYNYLDQHKARPLRPPPPPPPIALGLKAKQTSECNLLHSADFARPKTSAQLKRPNISAVDLNRRRRRLRLRPSRLVRSRNVVASFSRRLPVPCFAYLCCKLLIIAIGGRRRRRRWHLYD